MFGQNKLDGVDNNSCSCTATGLGKGGRKINITKKNEKSILWTIAMLSKMNYVYDCVLMYDANRFFER